MCGNRKIEDFFENKSNILENRKYSILCKSCMDLLFKIYYDEYFKSLSNDKSACKLALFDLCRDSNYPFLSEVFDSAYELYLKRSTNLIVIYLSKINAQDSDENIFNFRDGDIIIAEQFEDENIVKQVSEETKRFWGSGFKDDEYIFLMNKYEEWCESYPPITASEKGSLQHICLTYLRIHNKMKNNDDKELDKLYTTLNNLIKSGAYDGASAKKINESENQQAFGKWNEDIEKYMPSELFEKPELYRDWDNYQKYYNIFITNPCKNLITGNREFEMVEDNINNIEGEPNE